MELAHCELICLNSGKENVHERAKHFPDGGLGVQECAVNNGFNAKDKASRPLFHLPLTLKRNGNLRGLIEFCRLACVRRSVAKLPNQKRDARDSDRAPGRRINSQIEKFSGAMKANNLLPHERLIPVQAANAVD